jgi:hypothetical protein
LKNFETAIADQIAAENPDLIGLQEFSLWRPSGPAPPGFDCLAILQQARADLGWSSVDRKLQDTSF